MLHPDYDIDFKPAIARYDWHQTYDVLEFVHLPQGFSNLMGMVGIPCYELMAIDRYTPYNYLWAEQYSDYVYSFLKQFNFSPYSSQTTDEINIVKYSKTEEYKVTLTEGIYQITGLVYQGWKDGIIGSISTINQASYRFTLSEPTEIDLNQIINLWCNDAFEPNNDNLFCSNSLVISKKEGGSYQQLTPSLPNFLLYSDIAGYWGSVAGILQGNYEHIQEYLKGYSSEVSINRFDIVAPETEYYEPFPSHFTNFCYLQRANNNKWGGNLLLDLGVIFAPKISSSLSFSAISVLRNQGVIPLTFASQYRNIANNTFYSAVLNNYNSFSFNGEWAFYLDGTTTITITTATFSYLGGAGSFDYTGIASTTLSEGISNTGSGNVYPISSLNSATRTFESPKLKHISYAPLLSYFLYGKSIEYDKIEYKQSITRRFEATLDPFTGIVSHDLSVYSITGKYLSYLNSSSIINEEETLLTTFSNYYYVARFEHNPTGQSIPIYPFEKTIELTINLYSESEWLELYNYGSMPDTEYLDYLLQIKIQTEENMVDSVRLKEIHACLGAGEFAYYNNSGTATPYVMHIARNIDFLMKSFGIYYNPDGSIQSVVLNPAPPESEP